MYKNQRKSFNRHIVNVSQPYEIMIVEKLSSEYVIDNSEKEFFDEEKLKKSYQDREFFLSNIKRNFETISFKEFEEYMNLRLHSYEVEDIFNYLKITRMTSEDFNRNWKKISLLFFHENSEYVNRHVIFYQAIRFLEKRKLIYFIEKNKRRQKVFLTPSDMKKCIMNLKLRFYYTCETPDQESYNNIVTLLN